MAQIKTIDMFMNYPKILIAELDRQEELAIEQEQEEKLLKEIKN